MEISLDHAVGRLEGKIDLMLNNQAEVNKILTALHSRVDEVENNMDEVKSDQRLFKRDIKWITIIGLAIIALTKWAIGLFK